LAPPGAKDWYLIVQSRGQVQSPVPRVFSAHYARKVDVRLTAILVVPSPLVSGSHFTRFRGERDWYFIAEQPAPAPHLAHPEACAALCIVLVAVLRVSRSCEHFPDGFPRCRTNPGARFI